MCQITFLMFDHQIPYGLIMFLEEIEAAIRSGINSKFSIMGF